MALLFCKSSFCRTTTLLWIFVSLAGQLLGHLSLVFAVAAYSSPPGATSADGGQQNPQGAIPPLPRRRPPPSPPNVATPPPTEEQKRNMLKSKFQKMKRDVDELAGLAKAMQEELNKSNENIFPVDIVEKAEKIEKLAKKVKGSARGF